MKLNIDPETGEIVNKTVKVKVDKLPAITIDVSEVAQYHTDPLALAKKIEDQAGYAVFDVSTKNGRDECRSHAANIIKCINPAAKESARLAEDAKAIVKQDVAFRKMFETRVREIAEYHRKPLTEWEDEQARIEQERIEAENRKIAAEQYLKDWQDAIDFDELYALRKAKKAEEDRLFREQCEREEKERIEKEVASRLAAEKERLLNAAESVVTKSIDPVIKQDLITEIPKKRPIPTRLELINTVATYYRIDTERAERWLVKAFSTES